VHKTGGSVVIICMLYDVFFVQRVAFCRSQWLQPPPPQPFYSPFSGTTRVSQCQ